MISHAELIHAVHYDKDTGVFTWVNPSCHRIKPGDVVGSKHRMGYLETAIKGNRFLLHRLAWFYHYGVMPSGVIDHINGNKQDNRIVNLRDTNQVVNGLNRSGKNKNNSVGFPGVVFHKAAGRYMARIQTRYIGLFDTPEAAHAAYVAELEKMQKDAA